jgi:hypothetical protein
MQWRGTIATGAQAAIVIIEDSFIGASPFGQVLIAPPSGDADAVLSSIAGQSSAVLLQRAGTQRWAVQKNNATETGSNFGSDFIITRYSDAGGVIDNPLSISRATGLVSILDGLSQTGPLGFYGHGTATQTITGSRGSATVAVLASLLTAFDGCGLIVNDTTV